MLANSKVARQVTSRSKNPEYKFTESIESFSVGELAAPIIVFGDMEAGTVQKDMVEYFFENERLPTELGWSKKTETVTMGEVLRAGGVIRRATSLLTSSEVTGHTSLRRGLHGT
ncbi:hypothetical protein EJ05DRAFT_536531 [Pseudovirgaria hyperparasitica]|uniref:Heme haloperoxidase family profile domain-containing protein n=1 Tax=Pseudovirgaria hyperparasitica TaxID=470096 RepID=A0A6A6WGZ2_9PEZI|nr:uncharacterized protein EJ05DRAFT_536531 [Pseudovirgaria hyperparasitica]KAF2760421.1 hypothetical protein EJ05DRAFT_536531 [Pseudovirgaria hyperparasitica]